MKIKIAKYASGTYAPFESNGKTWAPSVVDSYMLMMQILPPLGPGEVLIAENLDLDSSELEKYTYSSRFDGSEIPKEGLKDALERERGVIFASEK